MGAGHTILVRVSLRELQIEKGIGLIVHCHVYFQILWFVATRGEIDFPGRHFY